MDSLGTGTGIGFQDWTVSEPESESKKLEPGTSALYNSLETQPKNLKKYGQITARMNFILWE